MTFMGESGRVVRVDLTGSTTHDPAFRSVDVTGDWPAEWDEKRLLSEAAKWAGVPVEQVELLDAPDDGEDPDLPGW